MSREKSSDRYDAPKDAPVEPIAEGRLDDIPFESPVKPVQLGLDDKFHFRCYPGISCFNECCKSIDIQLLPYDIIRLKNNQGLSSQEFVARYTMPFEMDFHGLPGLKLTTKPGSQACVFLSEEGCTVYEDRPSACRYYSLGAMGVLKKDDEGRVTGVEDQYFLVKEPHCKGHDEERELTVAEYRDEQGCQKFDDMNRAWRDLVIRKRSTGATVGKPSERSMQLFDMCSYDMDSFRDFIQSAGFRSMLDIDDATVQAMIEDEELLLEFAGRFLLQVLFGEMSIPLKEGAREARKDARKDVWQARRDQEVEKNKERDERYELPHKGF